MTVPIFVVLSRGLISDVLTEITKVLPGLFQEMFVFVFFDLKITCGSLSVAAIREMNVRRHVILLVVLIKYYRMLLSKEVFIARHINFVRRAVWIIGALTTLEKSCKHLIVLLLSH